MTCGQIQLPTKNNGSDRPYIANTTDRGPRLHYRGLTLPGIPGRLSKSLGIIIFFLLRRNWWIGHICPGGLRGLYTQTGRQSDGGFNRLPADDVTIRCDTFEN